MEKTVNNITNIDFTATNPTAFSEVIPNIKQTLTNFANFEISLGNIKLEEIETIYDKAHLAFIYEALNLYDKEANKDFKNNSRALEVKRVLETTLSAIAFPNTTDKELLLEIVGQNYLLFTENINDLTELGKPHIKNLTNHAA